jgi:integrase
MAQPAPVRAKIPTKNPQPSRAGVTRPAATAARPRRTGCSAFAAGTGRAVTRGDGRVVVEVEGGITVYPAQRAGDRWRAVWYEGGRRRQCEAVAEDKLAAKLAKVAERLAADAPGLERPGADLIAWYLNPDRHPAGRAWSRKHADTQRRLCERFAAPVIGGITCQDIRLADMQRIVNAAPTAGEGARLRRCLSAMVTAGIAAGYLTSPRLKEVHWQAAGRAAPGPQVAVAGESALFVDPAEIPADHDVARLGRALARGRRGDLAELMASTAAYTGLRQGELFALTAAQVAPAARVITVDRKVVEVAGTLYLEAPKGRKRRSTIYPARTPAGYPLADRLAARAGQARAEQDAGTNPLGLMFPSPAAPGGGPPTSTAASWRPPTRPPGGATPTAKAPGPGTACGTCSAPPPCPAGNSSPPTSPAWPATPPSASPSTCTSAPPPASWTAPAQPPDNALSA